MKDVTDGVYHLLDPCFPADSGCVLVWTLVGWLIDSDPLHRVCSVEAAHPCVVPSASVFECREVLLRVWYELFSHQLQFAAGCWCLGIAGDACSVGLRGGRVGCMFL